MLIEIRQLNKDIGLFCDDGLAASLGTDRQRENLSKKIAATVHGFGFKLELKTNVTEANFLDLHLDLKTYGTFMKPLN